MGSSPNPQLPWTPPRLDGPLTAASLVESARPEIVEAYRQAVPRVFRIGASVIAPILARIFLEILLRVAAPFLVPILSCLIQAFGGMLQAEWSALLKAILGLVLAPATTLHPVARGVLEGMRPDLIDLSRFDDPSAAVFLFQPPAAPPRAAAPGDE